MTKNVFITGPPGIGKTAVIRRLLKDLTPLIVRGFFKEEIIENNVCKGFRIVTLDFQDQILGHVFIEGPHRVSGFGINVEGFENLVLPQLTISKEVDLFVLDAIGPMECISQKFCEQVKKIMNSSIPMIATLVGSETPGTLRLSSRKDVAILQVNHKNKEYIWKNILLELE
jgi:nucleoside-triphosphatase